VIEYYLLRANQEDDLVNLAKLVATGGMQELARQVMPRLGSKTYWVDKGQLSNGSDVVFSPFDYVADTLVLSNVWDDLEDFEYIAITRQPVMTPRLKA
jgi:hypothetical protein